MDFKGITWVGNIYQKFETMCLEVEEAMYQDTVKYMENQVQKVGVSVKKFYSEVMDDLLPPSCVDPMSADLALDPFGHTDVNKKPIPSILDNHQDLKRKEDEDQVISNVKAEKESSLSGYCDINSLSPQSPGIMVESRCPESCAAMSKKVGVHRRPVGIKRMSKNNHHSKDSSQITSSSRDRRSKIASSDMRSNSGVGSDDTNVVSSSDLDVSREPAEAVEGNALISDTPIEFPASEKILASESVRQNKDDSDCISPASDKILSAESERQNKHDSDFISPASDKILSAESLRQNKPDSECISPAPDNNLSAQTERLKRDAESRTSCSETPTDSIGTSVNDVSFPLLGSSIRNKACNQEFMDKEVMVSNEAQSMKDGSSSVGATSCDAESWDKEIIMSYEDSFDMEVTENEEAARPRLENFEPVERVNLEESCVLVEGDNLHCVPHESRKHKSYKKKIREALSSKLRSRKDDLCVPRHKDLGRENNAETGSPVLALVSEKQRVAAHDSFESDWELL